MKDFSKVSRSLLASLMLTTVLTGCSSSSSTASTTSASGEVINVAVGNSMAPFGYLDADGNLIGYDVDVLKAVDEYLDDYTFNLSAMDFSTCVVSIDSGAADMVSHQLVKSEERKEKYIFPDQYYCLSPMSCEKRK